MKRPSLRKAIREARKNKQALLHCNVASFEQLKAVAQTAVRLDVPMIVGVSEGERDYLGVLQIRSLVSSYNETYGREEKKFQLFLNADHTHSLDKVEEAAEAKFDAILFDGGKLDFEENIRKTKEAAERARALHKQVLVEGELGYIGSSSEIFEDLPEGAAIRQEDLTRTEDAKRFVAETGIDLLAPAVGNVHGRFRSAPNPRLDIKRVRAIRRAARVPLVLHGGSGISESDIREAVLGGMVIVHIGTELRIAWKEGMQAAFAEHEREIAPYKILPGAVSAIETVIDRYAKLVSGSQHEET